MASNGKRLRQLQAIYDQVPNIKCKGSCTDECTFIPVTRVELLAVERTALGPVRTLEDARPGVEVLGIDANNKCQLLVGGRCSVYESRPLICRLYGVASGMPCEHGCKPDAVLSKEVSAVLLDMVRKL